MLFVGTSIIHPSTEGVFLLCNILDLLIYSIKFIVRLKSSDYKKEQNSLIEKDQLVKIKLDKSRIRHYEGTPDGERMK